LWELLIHEGQLELLLRVPLLKDGEAVELRLGLGERLVFRVALVVELTLLLQMNCTYVGLEVYLEAAGPGVGLVASLDGALEGLDAGVGEFVRLHVALGDEGEVAEGAGEGSFARLLVRRNLRGFLCVFSSFPSP